VHRPYASLIALTAVSALVAVPAASQSPAPRYLEEIRSIAADSRVAAALRLAEEHDDWALELLIELTEIPAPPFMEEVRGMRFAELLVETGADSVWTDAEGNVIGLRRGTTGDRTVGFGGHLDTVFPEGTDVTISQVGDTLFAPGVGDDTRGLVVVLSALRAMVEADVRTEDDVLFVGVVGEEGLGDLRGMKYLYREGGLRPDVWIDVDGGGIGRVVSMALGSVRYRITFEGPGGHSWGAFGTANPTHALSRSVRYFQDAAESITRSGPRTSYNVGRIGGGASVNAVPSEAWMEVDMRSVDPASLGRIEQAFLGAVDRALEEENGLRREGPPLTVVKDRVGLRPSGEVDPEAPLVQRALASSAHFGVQGDLAESSTDSNIPISMGLPAVTIGRGGVGVNSHAPDEYWINQDAYVAVQRAILLVVAESRLAGTVF